MVIIYGGTREQVEKQLSCPHTKWHGPCIDELSRYYKCLNCLCLQRDMSEEQYQATLIRDQNKHARKESIDIEMGEMNRF